MDFHNTGNAHRNPDNLHPKTFTIRFVDGKTSPPACGTMNELDLELNSPPRYSVRTPKDISTLMK